MEPHLEGPAYSISGYNSQQRACGNDITKCLRSEREAAILTKQSISLTTNTIKMLFEKDEVWHQASWTFRTLASII